MTADAMGSNIRPGAGMAVDEPSCVADDAHEVTDADPAG